MGEIMVKLLRWAFASMACMATLASPQAASAQGLRWGAGYHQIKHVFIITLENEGFDANLRARFEGALPGADAAGKACC